MIQFNPKAISTHDLLRCYADILDELKHRHVVRTFNNPVADYAEWLVAQMLDLELKTNSRSGYDATNSANEKFQIKSRRLVPSNKSRQMGVIRNLEAVEFDYLIAVLFESDFSLKEAYKIPQSVITKYAKFSKHQNGYILHLRGKILKDPVVEEITHALNNGITTA